jgi:uncharacterized membrane protein YbhN (UPF0104 family)
MLLIGTVGLVQRGTWVNPLLEKVEQQTSTILQAAAGKTRFNNTQESIKVPLREMLSPLSVSKYLLTVVGLSFGIQFVAAVGSQIFFLAAGYEIPFIVNLFVTPILSFIFLLPISFGSLGIREAAFIIIYGLFGVPAETALLVSFFALSGLLLNNVIGGLLIFFQRDRTELLGKAIRSEI